MQVITDKDEYDAVPVVYTFITKDEVEQVKQHGYEVKKGAKIYCSTCSLTPNDERWDAMKANCGGHRTQEEMVNRIVREYQIPDPMSYDAVVAIDVARAAEELELGHRAVRHEICGPTTLDGSISTGSVMAIYDRETRDPIWQNPTADSDIIEFVVAEFSREFTDDRRSDDRASLQDFRRTGRILMTLYAMYAAS